MEKEDFFYDLMHNHSHSGNLDKIEQYSEHGFVKTELDKYVNNFSFSDVLKEYFLTAAQSARK